jgi:hypothetical protein
MAWWIEDFPTSFGPSTIVTPELKSTVASVMAR